MGAWVGRSVCRLVAVCYHVTDKTDSGSRSSWHQTWLLVLGSVSGCGVWVGKRWW